jgi:DNA repair exonuclease SbcCD nuclease subunit
VKFIHSSDLQIGKAFGYFEPEVANILQDARQAIVRTLGEAAVKSGATAVLIAGDIYEKQQMTQQTLARAIQNMRAFNTIQWHLMPGNHDHFRENGLWDRLARYQLPANVTLHVRAGQSKSWTMGVPRYFFCPPHFALRQA